MTQENLSTFSKYARHFFSGTFLSRMSGMVRDIVMAATFGDHPSVAVFMVAFRFSHFLRRLLGEGTLQSIFIPHYEELRLQDENKAKGFFFHLYVLLGILLLGIIFLVEGCSIPFWNREMIFFFAWMFPSLFFISLYGLNLSLLQCKNAFFSSSIAPLSCNVIWIASLFLLAKTETSKAMSKLSFCILIGFAVQWAFTLPKTWNILWEGRKHCFSSLFHIPKEVRNLAKATGFGMLGVIATQINSFLDMLFARYADIKGPVYLWYAIRLEQLPLAVIGFACVYSITPAISRTIKASNIDQARHLFYFGYRRIFLFLVPCTFALFSLGFSSVDLLFGRGQFSLEAVQKTTYCLWAYGLSLLPTLLTLYQSSIFYAHSDTKTPMFFSFLSIFAHILLNTMLVFVFHLGAISIALSTSISAWLNVILLQKAFSQKKYWPPLPSCLQGIGKMTCIAFLSSLSCWTVGSLFSFQGPCHQLLHFFLELGTFTITFAFFLRLLYKQIFLEIQELIFPKKSSLIDLT